MVDLPPGFDASALVSDFGGLAAYIVGAYALIVVAQVILRALRS